MRPRLLMLIGCSLPLLIVVPDAGAAPLTERANVSSVGAQANAPTGQSMAVSADARYVVFVSDASNLVPGDTNGVSDVFVRDRVTGLTERISVSRSGNQANRRSYGPVAISTHGGFVTFTTEASNIAPGTLKDYPYTIVVNRSTRLRTSLGQLGISAPERVAISDGGRYVAFDSPEHEWTFVWRLDRRTGERRIINPLAARFPQERLGGMSADGSRVFLSARTRARFGLYVHDFSQGWNRRVDLNNLQQPANLPGAPNAISPDGTYVLFTSRASNLVPGDTNRIGDVFVRNVGLRHTGRVSVTNGGAQANAGSTGLGLSGGGRYRMFQSTASNLVDGDTNHVRDIFVRDLVTGTTRRCNVAAGGQQADGVSGPGTLSGSGGLTVFWSLATNLVANDTNNRADIFTHGPGC
jgi:hypothetical protein